MTKKDIYKEYGIEYRTADGKILSPLGWIKPLLLKGTNRKIGNAYTFSIFHGNEELTAEKLGKRARAVLEKSGLKSVKGSCPCHCKGCYCDFGCYNFDSSKASVLRKLVLCRFHLEWTEKALTAQMIVDKVEQCRIHAQGDFFSEEYAQMWARICKRFSGCDFWTYTKEKSAFYAFQDVENVHITPSITPHGINYGTARELVNMYNSLTRDGYKVHVCACGTSLETTCAECATGCKRVGSDCDYVLFIKHSVNDYDITKDYSFEAVQLFEIIRSQSVKESVKATA